MEAKPQRPIRPALVRIVLWAVIMGAAGFGIACLNACLNNQPIITTGHAMIGVGVGIITFIAWFRLPQKTEQPDTSLPKSEKPSD